MARSSQASRAFGALLLLSIASSAMLAGLLWRQSAYLAQGIWLACQSALQAVGSYLPLAGLLLPLALLLAGGLRALGMLATQLYYTRRLLLDAGQRRLSLPAALAGLADGLELTGRLTLVEDETPYAFAAGLWRPGIWLSTGLVALLDETELRAVLRHERHHVRRRDPLRVLMARSLAHGLFFLPVAAALRNAYLEAKEREADAASGAGHDLAAALLKLVRTEARLPERASLAAAGANVAADRIHRLLGHEAAGRRFDRAMAGRLAASLALAALLLLAHRVAISQAASPMTADRCGYSASPAAEMTSAPANYTPLQLPSGQ